MPTPTYDGEIFDNRDTSEDDRKLPVQFFMQAKKNEFKSAQEGRPIFDEIPMIRIFTPGSKDVLVTKASLQYQERFHRQWEKFKKNMEQTIEGTPLEEVPFLTVGQIAELKGVNCITLEQLANMPDSLAQKFMGAHQMRQRAKDYLAAAANAAPLTQMREALESRDAQISAQQAQILELAAQVKQLMAEKTAAKTATK